MKTIGKVWWIFGIFLLLRLVFIFTFPPFVDESIYINPKMLLPDKDLSFVAVSFWGKQPLPFWLFGLGSKLTFDPLIGARLINLLFAAIAFFGLYKLVKGIRGERVAKMALILLSFTPFFVFFQSLAIMDPLILSLTVIALALLFEIWRHPKISNAVFLGFVFGISFWIKNTGLFTPFFIQGALIYLIKTTKRPVNKLIIVTPPFVALLVWLPLILRKDFWLLWFENSQFSLSPKELLSFPFGLWIHNIFYFVLTLFIYLTPLLFISFFSLFFKKSKNIKFSLTKEEKMFFVLFAAFAISVIITAKTMRAKYYIQAAAPLLPLLALGLANFSDYFKKYSRIAGTFVLASVFLITCFMIISPPSYFSLFVKNSLIANERDYVFSWPSGYGMRETGDFVKTLARPFGLPVVLAMPAAPESNLSFYMTARKDLVKNLNFVLVGVSSKKEFAAITSFSESYDLYFAGDSGIIPEEVLQSLVPIKTFDKPGKEDYIGLYKVQF
ncbi:hypothetical protein A2697_00825 [Candidatus Curtissbacteria bacterium RIFCSPHIGHO2_01_FULL_41_44]|uniref:Glycosyltransferase RgtA/B/C/D-like domain-containing protein n=1 Tax=Candidatus Curtissbacteria bacterium RIFCSPLOWO2_01_FULL_42_50 TaxID=1797730 RepID=A0A1F5H7J7_9BACT|nr:MAG: hypothetical protein A2697_00825 [Candidatus Curtissbacteria bacterium RIFCSPHIGHO2_01_FULL_41_44]OGE00015.1 MAG: hypothetical protein A3B54_05155 [Candidatus Curtissbacteria bacterium RIFCSPLOWO2_01_FULL_42_50]OGE03312.1 MAG: hypothetical protein A3G16_00660 [Candidatus Curtissbacteria bacterium RIFCSPLOWO2_12_FULL_41_16]OGE11855.1 MAG: hypothetical protein A3H87_04160 [Candidatus Curtissbacteria bacterium RIFCSPLOWO2_02_FULL_42_37]